MLFATVTKVVSFRQSVRTVKLKGKLMVSLSFIIALQLSDDLLTIYFQSVYLHKIHIYMQQHTI